MTKKTGYILGIVFTILIGVLLRWLFCCNQNGSDIKSLEEASSFKTGTHNGFIFKDDSFKIESNDNFNFKTSDFNIIHPLSENLKQSLLNVKQYLQQKPSKQININGYYTSTEENNSIYSNLGFARANAVKNYLVDSLGFSVKHLHPHGVLNEALEPDSNNIFHGPIDYKAITINEDAKISYETSIKSLCDSIRAHPIELHFEIAKHHIDLTEKQRQDMQAISDCIDKLDADILITGHTDNTGDPDKNITLGQRRADFVKSYLVTNGISGQHIKTLSKGQSAPIVDNDTEEGRSKNRRVEITIK